MQSFLKLLVAVLLATGAGLCAEALVGNSPPQTPLGKLTMSAPLPFSSYQLSVDQHFIGVSDAAGGLCTTKLLDPTSLREVGNRSSCPKAGRDAEPVVAEYVPHSYELRVHVIATNPKTKRTSVGPVVMSIQSWSWAHSSIAEGDGAIWIVGNSELVEASAETGRVLHRFTVTTNEDSFLVVDADGLWLTPSTWGGGFCTARCTLWHVAPGSDRLVAVRRLAGVGTQWLVAMGHSIYADELTRTVGGYVQTIWRFSGPDARVEYHTPATLLPAPTFAPLTGYYVLGNAPEGLFTISQLGKEMTPTGIGDCDQSAPTRVVRIDPKTGRQSYIATVPQPIAGADLCSLTVNQAIYYDGGLFFLVGQWSQVPEYDRLVRVQT